QEFSQNLEVINRLGEEGNAASPVTKGLVQSVGAGADRLQESVGHFRLGESDSRPGLSARHEAPRAAAPQPATTFGD
ncbi:MAG: hypothetical protein WAM68_19095, partial [Acidobacteriaceae bacterium]